MLDGDVLRDPTASEHREQRTERMSQSCSERHKPDVLRMYAESIQAKRGRIERTDVSCGESDGGDLTSITPFGEKSQDERLDEDGAEEEGAQVLRSFPEGRCRCFAGRERNARSSFRR